MTPAYTPDEINVRWGEALNSGDLPGLLELYEDDAALVPQPGADPVTDRDAVEANLRFLIGLGGTITFERRFWVRHGELAVGSISYHLSDGTAPDGQPVELRGVTSEVARQQADGTWRYVIDHPFSDDVNLAA